MTEKLKTITDLEARDCRWPIGDPRQAGFHFCGARQADGTSYCEHHWRASFDETKSRARMAAPGTARRAA